MISTLLVEYARWVPLAFLLFLAVCVAVGVLLLRAGSRGRAALQILAALALIAVIPLTLMPGGATPEQFCEVAFAWPRLGAVETLANIAMLMPATYFLTLLLRRPVLVALGASIFSVLIELTQALLPALGRACDTTDWEMNTIGAVIAALLGWATYRLTRGPAPSATAQ